MRALAGVHTHPAAELPRRVTPARPSVFFAVDIKLQHAQNGSEAHGRASMANRATTFDPAETARELRRSGRRQHLLAQQDGFFQVCGR